MFEGFNIEEVLNDLLAQLIELITSTLTEALSGLFTGILG